MTNDTRTWREKARDVIEDVIAGDNWITEDRLRDLLSDAYPFGPRENYPYQVWCDEVNVQLDILFCRYKPAKRKPVVEPVPKEQMSLF